MDDQTEDIHEAAAQLLSEADDVVHHQCADGVWAAVPEDPDALK
ncbi:hypothetical protein ABZ502_17670 [Streptomyces abikoensis]